MKKLTFLNCFRWQKTIASNNNFSFLLFFVLLLFVCSNTASAQVTSYSFTQTADTYAPISGGTVLWTGYDGFDDETATVTLPNSFVFQGVTYTSVFVSANGYVLFGSTTTTNTPISAGRNAVSAFAADLDAKAESAGTGVPQVRWEQVGNEFVLQWANVCRYAATGAGAASAENLNFQIRLNTSTGAIKIVYGACVDRVTPLTTVYPQVGLGGGSATVYSNRTIVEAGGDWINSTAGTANNVTMAINGTTIPSNGLTYAWAPPSCVAPSGLTSVSSLNSATISWVASVSSPTNGYEYEVRTSGAAGSGAAGLFTNGTINGLTLPLSGLSANTTYTYYVRSDCGSGDYSAWASASFYTGHCIPSSTSSATYINNFSTTGGLANISNLASGYTATGYQNNYATATVSQYATGTINFASDIVGGSVGTCIWVDWNNDLVFDNATERVFATTAYGNNQTGSFIVPNGTALGDYRMRIRIDWNNATPDACASTNTRTEAEDYKLTVIAQPACLAPSGLTATANSAFTATLNWTASVSTPSEGYDYYFSATNTAPTAGSTPSGSVGAGILTAVISTGLAPSTTFYVWIRSNCGSSVFSDWTSIAVNFTTPCNPPTITGTTPGSVCGQGSATLAATSSEGIVRWYAANTGGGSLGTGATFATPNINTTTSYWAEAAVVGATQTSGKAAPATAATTSTTNNWGIVFNTTAPVEVQSVSVYSTTAGTINIKVTNAALTELYSTGNIAVAAGGTTTPNIIPINFPVPAGSGYRILVKATSGVSLIRDNSGVTFPYNGTDGVLNVTSSEWGGTTTASYYYFYDVKYSAVCASARTEVVATVTTAPALTLSTNTTSICPGATSTAVTVATGAADYDTYVWSPSTGVTGDAVNGWVFNPTVTTAYTLTASQSSGALCQTTATLAVTVAVVPIVAASATETTLCEGALTTLTANLTKAIGTDTTLTVQTEQPTAFCNRWDQYWNQTIFTAAELQAAGITAGNINSIAYNITTLGSGTNVTNFSVRIGTTANTTLSAFQTTGLTTVYGPATYAHAVGVNTITFDTPYAWDGISNIVLDIRQDGADSTNNAITYYTATATNMTISAITGTDSAVTTLQDLVAATTVVPAPSVRRLNVVFGTSTSNVNWSWTPGALTGSPVSVAPTETTTYTVTGTNTSTGCSAQAAITINVNSAPAPTGNAVQTIEVANAAEATVADLVVVGNNIAWYASEEDAVDDVNELALTTQLTNGATYYAVHTSVQGCRSAAFAVTVTVTLGNTSFDLAGLKYYPNPVTNELNVEYTGNIVAIEVYNTLGQKIASKNVNEISTTIDMTNLGSGTYFVKVQAENASRTIKVMKN